MKNLKLLCSVAGAALVWAVPVAAQDEGAQDEAPEGAEVRTAAARGERGTAHREARPANGARAQSYRFRSSRSREVAERSSWAELLSAA